MSDMHAATKRIGIDFDNTIVGYDEVFLEAAKRRGLLAREFSGSKQAIRDAIRLLPNGELAWQRLQAVVYGCGIVDAVMFEGVDKFLRRCRSAAHDVFIVSHKTEHGHFDPEGVNLREAALGWMERHGFFRADGYAIPVERVFFEGSRSQKLRRISMLGCTHFIDDLEEVLSDPGFPPINRILFAPRNVPRAALRYPACATWEKIEAEVFSDRG
jgi:hypothetical protein